MTAQSLTEPELVMPAKGALLPGGLHVRRAIPQARRRMVGPFIFLDEMGPAELVAPKSADVLAHPHIGLSTLTYLFAGEGLHKDSLGSVQRILPGEVNWMAAGGGIVHAEFMRGGGAGNLHGLQFWVAHPDGAEERDPSFTHYDADATRSGGEGGVHWTLISGSLWGERTDIQVTSPLFLVEARLEAGAVLELPAEYDERAVYVLSGEAVAGTTGLKSGDVALLPRRGTVPVVAREDARVILFGGDPLGSPRHIRWNFVSSSKDRLAQAAEDWRQRRFPRIPGEDRYIPLPGDGNAPVFYP
ncbi:MAG TPA: pirin family protein [Myxococcaceae bacterium]|nr:pirin family protein [Myxococcaceae bacterium]